MNALSIYQSFLVKRASQDAMYMGYSLNKFAVSNSLDISDLQKDLSCETEGLVKLCLCRHFAFGEAGFQQNIQLIANYTGIDAAKLASLLKRIAMQSSYSQVRKNSNFAPFNFVAAAREKEKDKDAPQSPEER